MDVIKVADYLIDLGPEGGKELAQYLKQSSPIKQYINVDIKGKKNTPIQAYITQFNSYIPTLTLPNFLLSKDYSFDPVRNTFNGGAQWILFDVRSRIRNDFTINKAQGF
jgi:hypothetical protein